MTRTARLEIVRTLRRGGYALSGVALAWALAGCTHGAAGGGPRPATPPPAISAAPATTTTATENAVGQQAHAARDFEDGGDYARAVRELRQLRARVAPDADLELALALDEARSGEIDSAMARLAAPLLAAAAGDSLARSQRVLYPNERDSLWINGRYDGWYWYVWRARAELAMQRGRWADAVLAARECVQAHPLQGAEWLLLAVSAGRADIGDQARQAAARAAHLDPTLPEALYLDGLWTWRAGRRADAQARFRAAAALDSTYRAPALALVRSAVPGATPDTLPTHAFEGIRRIGLLTSPIGPKVEEFTKLDSPVITIKLTDPVFSDSLKAAIGPNTKFRFQILVDETGHVPLHTILWYSPERLPLDALTSMLAETPNWRFKPPVRFDRPARVWVEITYAYRTQ